LNLEAAQTIAGNICI